MYSFRTCILLWGIWGLSAETKPVKPKLKKMRQYLGSQDISKGKDYHYCDTKWKAIDIYALENWKNIVVKDDFQWRKN